MHGIKKKECDAKLIRPFFNFSNKYSNPDINFTSSFNELIN